MDMRLDELLRERPAVTPALVARVVAEHARLRGERAQALRALRADLPVAGLGVRARNELVRSFVEQGASGTLRVATSAQRARSGARLVRHAARARNALERAWGLDVEALEVAQARLGWCMWFARALAPDAAPARR